MTAQELKDSIFQLTIQGKLVKQDPNDEPASVLLDRIKEERKKLVEEKKIKKEKYSEIYKDSSNNRYYERFEDGNVQDITEEIPFEIPDSWRFTRLYNVSDVYTGNSISETIKQQRYSKVLEGYDFIATKDVGFDNKINYDNGIKIPFNEERFKIAYKNTTIMCVEGGSVGRKVAYLNKNVCFGNKLATINSFLLNYKYIYYIFQTPLLRDFIKSNLTGIIGGISINKLKQFLFPIPPIEEQERIVVKLKQIEPYIKNYNTTNRNLEILNNSYKEELKKSILQYAIQGKLVKQDLEDEPAQILINKILEEKRELIKTKQIKKENLSVIYKDSTDNQFYEKFDDGTIKNITSEIPFDIPDNWVWTKIRNIAFVTKLAGFEYTKYMANAISLKGEVPIVRARNIKDDKFDDNIEEFISLELSKQLKRCALYKPAILMTFIGAGIGDVAIFNKNKRYHLAPNVAKIELYNTNMIQYILYYLMSQTGKAEVLKFKKSTAQPSLSMETIREVLVPVPPKRESDLISKKVKQLLREIT